MLTEKVEADVLIIGGGTAGMMAAIRAAELGVKVVVAEKANTLRSGAGGMGNDHLLCYIPDYHGPDIEPVLEEFLRRSIISEMAHKDILRQFFLRSYETVKLYESYGIPMRYNGKWEFGGHTIPGRMNLWLRYQGRDQKKILTAKALECGVVIRNRVMVFELLGDANGVSGALGVDARADKVIEFQAKSVVLSTGLCMRLYQPITPGWIGNTDFPFNLSGDGRAMAYRLGAELTNVEWPYRHSGIAYFQRNGRGSWLGVLRDYQGKSIGPFIDKPSLQYGDSAMTAVEILDKHLKTGKGTIYIDHRGMSDKELEYMAFWLTHEQQIATLNHLQEEGIDLGKHQIGFMSYGIRFKGGVSINTEAETSVRGLYAAGDEFTISIGPAATYGRIAGENAAKYAKAIPAPDIERSLGKIEEIKSLIERIRSRQWGPDWLEANVAIQQTMNDFAGLIRSESGLDAGLSYLRRVKEKVHKGIMARNQWELIRCLEVINLLDQGELVFITAKARQETRYKHVRSDYPMTHPNMEKLITVKKINEKPVLNWVELRK